MLQTESGDSGWTSKLNPWNNKLTIQKYGTVVYKLYNSKTQSGWWYGWFEHWLHWLHNQAALTWLGMFVRWILCIERHEWLGWSWSQLGKIMDTPWYTQFILPKYFQVGLLWPNKGLTALTISVLQWFQDKSFKSYKEQRDLVGRIQGTFDRPRSLFGIWAPRRDVSEKLSFFVGEMGLSMTLDQLLKSLFSHVDRETMRNGWILGHLFQSGWRRVRALLCFINTTTIKHRSLQSSHVPDSETLVEGTCKVQSPFKHRMTNSSNYHRKLAPIQKPISRGKDPWWKHGETQQLRSRYLPDRVHHGLRCPWCSGHDLTSGHQVWDFFLHPRKSGTAWYI